MVEVAVERGFYSIAQAAARIGVSRVTLWRWINAGRVPAQRLGHRTARIRGEDLQRLMLPHAAIAGLPPANRTAHAVQFYDSDWYLVGAAAAYLGAGLRAGTSALVVATPLHRAEIEGRLHAAGFDVAALEASGDYMALDAAETLECFMVNGTPNRERFREVVGYAVRRAVGESGHLRVFGEMVAVLAARGHYGAAIKLEQLWNELRKELSFALLCAYPLEVFGGGDLSKQLSDVCDEHAHVVPAESYLELDDSDAQFRDIARLQQKAQSLEREVIRRQAAEDQLRVALAAEQTARQSAEAALQARDEFVSVASHELKTPLTTLSGYAQLVLRRFRRDGEIDPTRVVDALQAINTQADKLGRLVGHLLDVTRLDEGKLALNFARTDVAPLVEQVVASARATSGHAIRLEAPPTLEIRADALRLEQVLVNLLDNAVKYSPGGGQIDVVVTPRGRHAVEVSVRDHGLGIPRRRRRHIFERFYQAHADGHRSGLGLGLYISRQIVELHSGQIRAEFPRGGGTRFVVRLPRGHPERTAG